MKVARAGDLPHSRGMTFFGGMEFPMPAMPAVPAVPGIPRGAFRTMENVGPIRMEFGPEFDERLDRVRVQLDRLRPQLERIRTQLPRAMRRIDWRAREI